MEKLNGSSVIQILENTMNLMEPRLMDHGERVAFILRSMLEYEGNYTKEELDKIFILALLHDIGAYKTDEIDQMLTFDTKGVWNHSIYGYLYLRYLSPLEEYAEILLYHHLESRRFGWINYKWKDISRYLHIADRVDVLLCQDGGKLNNKKLEEGRDIRFWGKGLDLFYEVERHYSLVKALDNEGFKERNKRWMNLCSMTEEECRSYLKLIVFTIDFRSEKTVLRSANTNVVALGICRRLGFSDDEKELVYYATLIYDMGMLGIPKSITGSSEKLSDADKRIMQTHVDIMTQVMSGCMDQRVIDIAAGHHEKLDGTGYPRHLRGSEISRFQRILAVADIVSALSCENNRRIAYDSGEVIETIRREANEGKLDPDIVELVVSHLDQIMEESRDVNERALANYMAIKEQFSSIIVRFQDYND